MKSVIQFSLMTALLATLAACSLSPDKPRPAVLPAPAALIGTPLIIWSAQVGATPANVLPRAVRDRLFTVGAGGKAVLALDANSGREVWRVMFSAPVTAGVGTDGDMVAVVTQENELVGMVAGEVRWRQRLTASVYTAPLVAGRRVFVSTADRTVQAFDAENGRRLWSQSRNGDPLVLSQSGVLLAVGNTLVVGLAGRLVGLDPINGSTRWDVPIATGRGTNEIERLTDLVGPASRVESSICVRAYASAIGCVDAQRGTVVWTRAARGMVGLGGDEQLVFGTESDGRLLAWRRDTGQIVWSMDRLLNRQLGVALVLGKDMVVVGDSSGLVHLVSREDGSELARLMTDNAPILSSPMQLDSTLLVQTHKGGVFAWRLQ